MSEETKSTAEENSDKQSGSTIDHLPRALSITVIVGFFLPWLTFSGEIKNALEVFIGVSRISAFDFALGLRDYHILLLLIPFAALNAFFRNTKEGYLFSSLLILSLGFIFGPNIYFIKGGATGEIIKQSYGFYIFYSASVGILIYGVITCRNNPNFFRSAVGAILCVTILASSAKTAKYFVDNQKDTERRTPPPKTSLVEGITLQPTDFVIELPSQGRVQARAISSINPEVTGRILSIEPAFKEGGFFKPGQKLLTLDNSDYRIAITKTEGTLAQLEARLALEKIERSSLTNAVVIAEANLKQAEANLILKTAERDAAIANLKRINQLEGASSLAKKEPQVTEAKANVLAKQASLTKAKRDLLDKPAQMEAELLGQIQVAESEVEQAQKNLKRTIVYAPLYQGRITEKRVDIGQVINPNTVLATAIATDYAEVRLPVSNHRLSYLNIPEQLVSTNNTQALAYQPKIKPTPVKLSAQIGADIHNWKGEIDRAESRYDAASQQLFLIAQVPEPYVRQPALRAGLFVRAKITGKTFENVFKLPRQAVRRGDEVALAVQDKNDANKTIIKRKKIEIIWRDEKYVISRLNDPLKAGDILITTPVEYATDGQQLRVAIDGKPPPEPQKRSQGKGGANKPDKGNGKGKGPDKPNKPTT